MGSGKPSCSVTTANPLPPIPAVNDPDTLRQRLWEITDGPDKAPSSEHARLFADLAYEVPHKIEVLPNPFTDVRVLESYTCFVYVLDLVQSSRYVAIAGRGLPDVFAGKKFMRFLMDNAVLREVTDQHKNDGNIIIYFDGDQPKHAGILNSDRVRSKWGTGLFLEHGVWEVPISYGRDRRFFEPLTQNEALGAFLAFAKSNGVDC